MIRQPIPLRRSGNLAGRHLEAKKKDVLMSDSALLAPQVPTEHYCDGDVDDHAEHPVRLQRVLCGGWIHKGLSEEMA